MKEYIDRSDSVSHNYAQRLIPESLKSFQNVPIVPSSQSEWTLHDHPERLVRLYAFDSYYHRNMFIGEVLAREEETGHEAKITVEGVNVTVEVWTHDIERVTELDKECADFCDTLYNDVSLMREMQ
tara:strand:- start:248 stop:625 length:378 start_codon:yes stop_codon:yes gene_type:complete